jgi:hypothetical protein
VGTSSTTTITINDDDSFYTAANSSSIRADTVRIWVSSNDTISVNSNDTSDAHLGITGTNPYEYVSYTFPQSAFPILLLTSTKGDHNIRLSVNLANVPGFGTILNSQNRIHYVVEAVDSWVGKFVDETGTLTTGVNTPTPPPGITYTKSRRVHYSFVRDTLAPLARISGPKTPPPNPVDGLTFGATGAGFEITGSISDANLKRYPTDTDDYVIGINVDNKDVFVTTPIVNDPANRIPFVLGNAAGNGSINAASPTPPILLPGIQIGQNADGGSAASDTRVNFTINNANSLNAVKYDELDDGRHTLILVVEDRSGQKGSSPSLVFFKDTRPPTFSFIRGFNDNKTALPKIDVNVSGTVTATDWWTAVTNTNMAGWSPETKADYRTKRDALKDITYDPVAAASDNSAKPSITGTFTDILSDINTSSFQIAWDGSTTFIPIPSSQVVGNGKNATWTVYLTSGANGVAGTPTGAVIADGVHSIQLRITDAAGNIMQEGNAKLIDPKDANMFGFRIVSSTPTATFMTTNPTPPPTGTIDGRPTQKVYGDREGVTNTAVFTLIGEGTSANLSDVLVRIRYTDANLNRTFERSVLTPNTTQIPGDTNSAALSPSPLGWTFTTSGDKLEWSLAIHRSYIMYAGNVIINDQNKMRAGNYEVRIIAKDSAGAESEETADNTWQFVVDSAAPTFTFNHQSSTGDKTFNASAAERGPAYWVTDATTRAGRNLLGETPRISGRVSDASNLDAVELQLAKWDYNGGTGNTGAWTIYRFSGGTNVFVTVADATAAANDNYWRKLLATPGANASDYVVDWPFTLNDNTSPTTPLNLPDGYYSVRLRARDVSKVKAAASTGWVAADHDGNPDYSHYMYFFIDTKPPDLTITTTETTFSSRYKTNYGLTFNVNADDLNMFESLTASVERVNTTLGVTPANVTVDGPKQNGSGVWPAVVTIPFTPREVVPTSGGRPATGSAGTSDTTGGLPDGQYRIVFTAIDLAGRTARETHSITLDNRAPTGVIEEPRFRGEITTPAVYRFGSEVMIGGEAFNITGTADDTGLNGSPTGPKEIWYRIGYGTQALTSLPTFTALPANATDAQKLAYQSERQAAIMAWAVHSGSGLDLSGLTGVAYDRGATSNDAFEAAAKKKHGSLWFKYTETTSVYDVPALFDSITAANAADPYTWSLTAGTLGNTSVATNYARGLLTFRGKDYLNGAEGNEHLAREITTALPANVQSGIYSLPLVIRVVDNAGNASYELRDIWLYPNGDNPSSTISNPANRFTPMSTPRGGQFSIDGVASDNVSVRTVIYRVKVDNTQNTAAGDTPADRTFTATGNTTSITNPIGGNVATRQFTYTNHGLIVGDTVVVGGTVVDGAVVGGTPRYVLYVSGSNFKLSNTYTWPTDNAVWNPATGNQTITATNIVTIPGANRWTSHTEYNAMSTRWNSRYDNGANVTNGGASENDTRKQLSQHGWYLANLESSPYDSTMPWSFMLNGGGEISGLIQSKGFGYPSTAAANNMIRVWVEALVFDGAPPGGADASYNLMSLGSSFDANNPRPYVREFYFTASAPTITNTLISALTDNTAPNPNPNATYGPALAANYVRSGNFAVRATLNGNDNNINEIHVRLRGETDSSWRPVYVRTGAGVTLPNGVGLGGWTGGTPGNANARTATLTYTFNSTATSSSNNQQAVRDGLWAKSSGTLTAEVRVRDSSNPPAEAVYTFEIGVDNFAPLADASWSTTSPADSYVAKNVTSQKVAGSGVTFLGRVFDYQTNTPSPPTVPPIPVHRKISAVHVWFTKTVGVTTSYVNMATGATATSVTGTNTSGIWIKPQAKITWTGVNNNNVGTIVSSGTPSQGSLLIPTATNFVKVLNDTSSGTDTWSPSANGAEDVFWSFQQNTTVLPDGWMTMHYVVVDQANNRSYYSQDMIVMNNYPKITNVTLYTNNTGEGAVFTTHTGNEAYSDYVIPDAPYASGYLNSGFISKNRVIGFGVETIGTKTTGTPPTPTAGNTPLHYQARYVERYLVPLSKDNLIAMAAASAGVDGTTASLYHLGNGVTLNANGVPSNPALTDEDDPESGFVNLYTIATGNVGRLPGGVPVWRLLGVTSPAVSDGSHFVFQGIYIPSSNSSDPQFNAENNVNNMAGFDNVYVYAYKEVIPKTAQTPATPNKILPEALNFSGSGTNGDFSITGTTEDKIPDAKAETTANALDWAATGTAYFLIKVWDTVNTTAPPAGMPTLKQKDMLYDAIVIGTRVYLNDTTNPKARLYDLNPYTEAAVTGNNLNDTFKQQTLTAAAAPTAVGANIKRGGLYNTGTTDAPVKSGYIDPRSGSLALNPWVSNPNDPTFVNPYKDSSQARPNGFVTGDVVTGGAANDKVSGSVILRGLAWDDQLVDEVRVIIAGVPKVILKLQYVYPDGHVWSDEDAPDAAAIQSNNLTRKMMPVAGETGFYRKVANVDQVDEPFIRQTAWAYEAIHWQTGHTVEWAYLWNTETEPATTGGASPVARSTRGGPLGDVTVSVQVQDLNGRDGANHLTSASSSADAPPTIPPPPAPPPIMEMRNNYMVDIVPYVTGFERDVKFMPGSTTTAATPLYATKRSRQGWYSFFRGEGNIAVRGYNLGTGNLTMSMDHGDDGTATMKNTGLTGPGTGDIPAYNAVLGHIFSIPSDVASGRINVKVGGTDAGKIHNHNSSHTNKSWNRENSAYTAGSDLWVNKPHAHIWDTNNDTFQNFIGASGTNSGNSVSLKTPGMALEYVTGTNSNPGRLHGAWATYVSASYSYGTNSGVGQVLSDARGEPYAETDISISNGRVHSTIGNNTNPQPNVTAVYQQDGNPYIGLSTTMRNNNPTQFSDNTNLRPTERWRNSRISKAADNDSATNPGLVYITSYDSYGKRLFFGYQNSATAPAQAGRLIIDGPTTPVDGMTAVAYATANIAASTNAGGYNAVDYDNVGPIIAYYDEGNDTVRLALGRAQTPGSTDTQWYRRYLLPTGHALRGGSGKYISLKVDRRNGIHLAFYNSSQNTVVYAYASSRTVFTASGRDTSPLAPSTTLNYGSASDHLFVCTVDNVVRGGQWTDISVDNRGNPMIVYGDSSRLGNYDGIRIAYLVHTRSTGDTNAGAFAENALLNTGWETINCPVTGANIRGWEAVSLPSAYTVNDDRLNIEVWPPTNRADGGANAAPAAGTLGTAPGWSAAVGYGSDRFRVGYFFYPTYKGY